MLAAIALVKARLACQVNVDFEEGLRQTIVCTRIAWQETGDAV